MEGVVCFRFRKVLHLHFISQLDCLAFSMTSAFIDFINLLEVSESVPKKE